MGLKNSQLSVCLRCSGKLLKKKMRRNYYTQKNKKTIWVVTNKKQEMETKALQQEDSNMTVRHILSQELIFI